MGAIVTVENLSKRYRIRDGRGERYVALRDVLAAKVRDPLGWLRRTRVSDAEEFWALRDVSFEVSQGDVIGIIGRNGAGKSTLLKIISRITEPTTGRLTLGGRVASLLEVGTGFHPELTGRENILLNGAILGMSRAEILRKFNEIVAFAEIERFLETPVKRYSSGMYVRLAFAVAAHLEAEILIIDEVLAVGDVEFQRKCLDKMKEVTRSGRTVLFVSHQIAAVQNLCHAAILLTEGQVTCSGSVGEVIRHYLSQAGQLADVSLADRVDREGSGIFRFAAISFQGEAGQPTQAFTCGSPAIIELLLAKRAPKLLRSVRVSIGIDNDSGQRVLLLSTEFSGTDFSGTACRREYRSHCDAAIDLASRAIRADAVRVGRRRDCRLDQERGHF